MTNPHVSMSSNEENLNKIETLRSIYTLIAFSGLDINRDSVERFERRCSDLHDDSPLYFSFDVRGGGTNCSVSIDFDVPSSWNRMPITRCDIEKEDGSEWTRYGLRCEANVSSSGGIKHDAAFQLSEMLGKVARFLFHVELLNVPNDHPNAVYVCTMTVEQKQQKLAHNATKQLAHQLAEAVYAKFDGKYPKNSGNIKSFKLSEIGFDREAVRALKPFTHSPSTNLKYTHVFEILETSQGFCVFVQKSDKS